MQTEPFIIALSAGLGLGLIFILIGVYIGRRSLTEARAEAQRLLAETTQETESKRKEILVAAQEKILELEEQTEKRDRDLDTRESRLDQRESKLERENSELGRNRKRHEARETELARIEKKVLENKAEIDGLHAGVRETLEKIAGLTVAQARERLIAGIEEEARTEGATLARKIEDEARETAEKEAINLMVQASQRVNLSEVAESTVSFIELPSDEMKGRIIGKEGRNIRAMEMATGIDLVVDDTPRTILISSFDPVRREIARVAIHRLVEDGRIHPARIEEVVQKVGEEVDELIDEKGNEAAFRLGISDLHPKLTRLVGRMRYHTARGQNLLQHCMETALIAGFMADAIGARVDLVHRAGLLHEIGQVDDTLAGQTLLASAELCAKYDQPHPVVEAIRALHPDAKARSLEAALLSIASRLSDCRPGARKENLAVFIERLRRLEGIATSFAGVERAYAVKAGKEIRVLVDAGQAKDENIHPLSKQIARAIEKELNYPGQIKVNVVRHTRAVKYAL